MNGNGPTPTEDESASVQLSPKPGADPASDAAAPAPEVSSPKGTVPKSNFPIVAIGASAGGLEAFKSLVSALPVKSGMAFILIQHLDPNHDSLMVEILSGSTQIPVHQAENQMPLQPDNLYVIPPGAYLAVRNGAIALSEAMLGHGARLPFDFLLSSLAENYATRTIGVILSGTGMDGSIGLKAIKVSGGFVIAQDPAEARFDGMPRNAILTGVVDRVLTIAQMPAALEDAAKRVSMAPNRAGLAVAADSTDGLSAILSVLKEKTSHDFAPYKQGTMQRRIERRIVIAGLPAGDTAGYLRVLEDDPKEPGLLAEDLLINVTSFFRDKDVFDLLAASTIPDLLRERAGESTLRLWIPGCSTGEEVYSIGMLFVEALEKAQLRIKLQIFASDMDRDAIATARLGAYLETIATDISSQRLARFFSLEDGHYKITAELRNLVVFTVQDVLSDPPFSKLDFVSCRNLMIYLEGDAQAKLISLFHFSLRPGGVMLLGSSETPGDIEGRFEVISREQRIYRRIGLSRMRNYAFNVSARDLVRPQARAVSAPTTTPQSAIADLCRRMVLETHAPAASLINHKNEVLYSLGAVGRYLHVSPGFPTHDLLEMAGPGLRTKLRAAIQLARKDGRRALVAGETTGADGETVPFNLDVLSFKHEGEELMLVSFIDQPIPSSITGEPLSENDAARLLDLEKELDATRTELEGAIHSLEVSNEEQKAINEEALSINEEYQSTNEELLTSKEELQSLNEELTALNAQLQETLERQRTTSNDLQNILYSTNVATLFLDAKLSIRFFTPATHLLFRLIPGDIGRPLSDLQSLASDVRLLEDAKSVLSNFEPIECEIETNESKWFSRRILPYRTQNSGVEGVVITFTDITERKAASIALEVAKRQAEVANIAKSRFLAAASHDLRQPLQTLSLLHGLLDRIVNEPEAKSLLRRVDETLGSIASMLNMLLDVNQIEAGLVEVHKTDFPIEDLLHRLKDEFSIHAEALGLELRVARCSVRVHSDVTLLEQMLRNLLSNALKYTKKGGILLGCRRRASGLSIEVWDTGIGIPSGELDTIFEEYHQVDNDARERSKGLGLGLFIVQRMGKLLEHGVTVRSSTGNGSGFAIEVAYAAERAASPSDEEASKTPNAKPNGSILVIEDNALLRLLYQDFLVDEGYSVTTAEDGPAAIGLCQSGDVAPDLVLSDYNLPAGMNGVETSLKLRAGLRRDIPVIILTGDITSNALRHIKDNGCIQMNKPVRLPDLAEALMTAMAKRSEPAEPPKPEQQAVRTSANHKHGTVFVVDDDPILRSALSEILLHAGRACQSFSDCESFLETYRPGAEECLLIDAYLPGMRGLELLSRLRAAGHALPAIMLTGNSDVRTAVQAMKAGASDFIEKPVATDDLLASIDRALALSLDLDAKAATGVEARRLLETLTVREQQVLEMVLAGHPSKNIAADLHLSQRTVENHRASIMRKTLCKSIPALARLVVAADSTTDMFAEQHSVRPNGAPFG